MSHFHESSFTVRKPAWHGLSYVADRNPESVDEALQWAGADWEPVSTPVFGTKESLTCASKDGCQQLAVAMVNNQHPACGRHANKAGANKANTVTPLSLKQLAGYHAVTRGDTGDTLAVANSTYEIFSNRETFELVEMLLGSKAPQVAFETGGVLKGGKLVWALARVDEPMQVPGDPSPIYPYISVLNSHDGSAALRAINTSIQIVCYNTWSAAETEAGKSGREFSFRHTSTIRDRIEVARETLLGARDDTAAWVEYATKYIAIPFSDQQVDTFLKTFIPEPPAATDRVMDNIIEARNAVKSFYHSPSCAGKAGTAWGIISAVGEYLDHGRTWRSRETYVARSVLKSEPGKRKAIQLVDDLVGV